MWKAVLLLSAAAQASGGLVAPRPPRHPLPGVPGVRGPAISTDTFEQKLDHFSPVDQRTWRQQYVSWVGAKAGDGPTFIVLGGQEPVRQLDLMHSFAKDISDSLQGRSFYLEHRFYGDSRPTGDLTLDSLRYLSQDQALADVAYFIKYLRQQSLIPAQSKVVLYGGAYAGNLAAWARLKYPHLVHAAVASSAPLQARVDFPEYIDEVMKQIERFGGKQCVDDIREVVDYVDAQSKTPEGIQGLVSTFKLCPPFGNKPWDVEMLFDRIATVPISTVSVLNEDPSVDIVGEVCGLLHQGTTAEIKAEAMAEAGGFGLSDDKTCETISYEAAIANARKEQWGAAVDQRNEQVYDRPMLYQACTEQGDFHTLAHWRGHFPLALSLQKCKDVFGSSFDEQLLQKAVSRTNQEYGGSAPEVRRVVFVRGELDPNNVLGVRDDLEDMEPVITIAGQSACADVAGESRRDPDAVKAARTLIRQQLTKFLAMTD